MRPAFRVTVNGSNITDLIADRLVELSVTDEAGVKSDRVDLTIDDRDQRLAIPSTKAKISVAIGYADRLVDKGAFVVEEVELEGPLRRMTIRANAAGASRGAGAAKRKGWHDTTLGSIAETIADDRGWELAISDELWEIEIPHVDQTENDLQFLTRLAAQNGAVAKVADDRLVIAKHAGGKSVSGKKLPRIAVTAGEGTTWVMTLAERGGYKGVKATWYDMDSGDEGEEVNGEDGDNTHTLPHTYATKDEAARAAKSKRDALNRGKYSLSVTMPGDPRISAECEVDLSGFRVGVDGVWVINSVTHSITDRGYSCSFRCEKPGQEQDA